MRRLFLIRIAFCVDVSISPCSREDGSYARSWGISQSALPYRRSVPTWLKLSTDDVKEHIYKLLCVHPLGRKDRDSKFRLILVESRIHRLARYYKRKAILAPNWKYESSTASALVA
ncbi:unnamed protein product [Notodromas monacha]|uniref:Small ribosomal subunit protein uS15 n=1 Tax=Notodromas monacha TaxID=399045 RepID=A0A7R9BRC5_9CRUS|nr:unnamed protein product [Notodromas monacha]CAG0920250.1 unnamed protein product [Notodromas monacha]